MLALLVEVHSNPCKKAQEEEVEEVDCCKRPGVVGPLTPVGSKENTLLMKRARAVLSRTQIPSTASSNASGTDFHHNTVWDTPTLGSAAGLTNEQSNEYSVAR